MPNRTRGWQLKKQGGSLVRYPVKLPAKSFFHSDDWWNGKILGDEETVTLDKLFSTRLELDTIPVVPPGEIDYRFINAVIAAVEDEK
jgi:hypothetical protein